MPIKKFMTALRCLQQLQRAAGRGRGILQFAYFSVVAFNPLLAYFACGTRNNMGPLNKSLIRPVAPQLTWLTHRQTQTQTQCKWGGVGGQGTREKGRRCVTCLTICTPRLGHIPFQIVVIEGIAMWQIPKYPVSISVRCVAFSFFLSLSPLSSAQLDLA